MTPKPGPALTPHGAASLVDLLLGRAEERPESVVFAFSAEGEADGPTLTFGGLDQRAKSIGAWLQTRGLTGERVLLVFPPGLDFIAAFFGCLYAGAVAVPAATPRANRPMTRLKAVVDDAGPAALLTTNSLLPAARKWLGQVPALGETDWLGVDSLPDSLGQNWSNPKAGPETLAFLQYTSGSTALPKGVMVTHGNLLHNSALIRESFGSTPDSRGVFWLPLFHDMGLIGGVLQTIYCGGSSTLMSPVSFLQRPLRWLEAISRTGATISGGPNFAFDLCARKITDAQKAGLDLSSWSVAFNGAEPVRAETLDRFASAFASRGFRREAFLPCYGLAESTLMVTAKRSGKAPTVLSLHAADLERDRGIVAAATDVNVRRVVGSGPGFEGLRIAIVDPETAEPRAEGEVGEVWVSGLSVAAGYWDRPEASAETFAARLRDGSGPFLRTGDLGFLRSGELFVTGRSKDLLIVRGRNVYPQDVEWSASQAHLVTRPEGAAAFVVDADDEERLVVVQEVERLGQGVDPASVIDAIRAAIAGQHDLDVHAVVLIKAMSLPKTSSGKVQRHACRSAYLAGTLDEVAASVRSIESKIDPVKTTMSGKASAEIVGWLVARLAATLNLDASAVDLHRPFASFGLGSLQAVGLAGDLEEWLGRPLAPTLIYDHPTIETLARHLAGENELAPRESTIPAAMGPIAVIGIGCRFPGADGPLEFWKNLSEGVDAVGSPPMGRQGVGRAGADRAGFLEQVDGFDASFFGIAPREALYTDPQQRLLLEVAWEAIEDAGLAADRLRGTDVGVFVGVSTNDYGRRRVATDGGPEAYALTGNALSVAANRISYVFDFRGPSLAVDSACSSSLVAVHLACESLRRGEASVALAAGVSVILAEEITATFGAAGFLSPDGRCKAFDASADGYVRGEGVGVVVLKPLERAQADGDPIYAVVRGSAVNQDGRSNGLTAPNRESQEAVLRAAYRAAGVAPSEVDYVEAHGTGTLLGDPIEAAALAAVVGPGRPSENPCMVGSVKTNIGHLEAAAGIAGVIKVALALDRGQIPPSLHFATPNPHIPFDTLPIRVGTGLTSWPVRESARLAGVSSFGFGGTNAHAVLASAPPRPANLISPSSTSFVIPISAQSREALRERLGLFRDTIQAGDFALVDLAYSAGARRSHQEHRIAIVARSRDEAVSGLNAFLQDKVPAGRRPPNRKPRSAFVFSGQGSQWWGMGRGLIETEPVVAATIDDLDRRFQPLLGWSIREELAVPASRSRLEETGFGQPVVFALQVALARLWASWGLRPDAVIGHSLGEIAAAHLAGAIGLDDAVQIVGHRATLMQSTVGLGSSAAVALGRGEAERLVADDPDRLALAAVNGPNASVISGATDAVLGLVDRLRARGVFAKVLSGRCAFHGPQMDPIRAELAARLAGIQPRPATIPIFSTVTGLLISGGDLGADYWARNLRETVRFAEAAAALIDGRYDAYLEVGPHPALRQPLLDMLAAKERTATVLGSIRRGDEGRDTLLHSVAAIYGLGFPIDWRDLASGGRFCRLPRYPFQRERFWIDPAPEPVAPSSRNGEAPTDGTIPTLEKADSSAKLADFYEVEWQGRDRTGALATGGTWLILEDSLGVGSRVRDRLAEGGRCVSVVRAERFEDRGGSVYGVRPESVEDLRAVRNAVGPVAGVLHLWNLDAALVSDWTPDAFVEAQKVGCASVLAVVETEFSGRLWVVTAGANAFEGREVGPSGLAQAPVWGLGRSIALERPATWGGLVDLDPDALFASAPALADELRGESGEDQIRFRGGQRFVARLARRARLDALPGLMPIKGEGTYLVTGGLGDLGLKVAQRLVEHGARRLVLIGRRGLPDRPDWDALPPASVDARKVAAIRAMERLGATVHLGAVDLADSSALADLFADLRRLFPPVRGLIHAAGVVGNAGWDADPLRSKIAGTWALHELSRALPLDFFVVFSSVAAVLGAKEAGYAAANHFLDAFAHHRRANGLPALSVNWGPWAGAGMAAEAGRGRAFDALGISPLSVNDGLDALTSLMASGRTQAVVADIDWNVLKDVYTSNSRRHLLDGIAGQGKPQGVSEKTIDWRSESAEESRAKLLKYLRGRLARVLKLDPGRIDTQRPIDTMGLDSLMAIELKNGVETDLGAALPLASLLEGPTLDDLASRVFDQLDGELDPRPALDPRPIATDRVDAPLSSGQRALWSIHQFDPLGSAYNMAGAVRINGQVNADALRAAAQRLVDRHASLRTHFPILDGEPVQRIEPRAIVAFTQEDIAGLGDEELAHRLSDEATRPFDLAEGPLFRIILYRRSENEHALLLSLHHAVGDFWSIAVLLDELGRIYPALLSGIEPDLPALASDYADFARWQSEFVNSAEGDRQWAYWQGQLTGPCPVLTLPSDQPRPSLPTSRGASRSIRLDADLTPRLSALGRDRGASLFVTMLAAFQVVLARLTGQNDVIVGSPVVGRNRPELAGIIGYFVNALALRTRIDPSESFVSALDRVRATVIEALANQDLPFAVIADRVEPIRDPGRSPLFQVMFVYQKAQRLDDQGFTSFVLRGDGPKMVLAGLPLESIALETRSAQFDLTVQVAEDQGRLAVSVEYRTDLFDAESIDRFLDHYATFLNAAAVEPECAVGDLTLISEVETERLSVWGDGGNLGEEPADVITLFERCAVENPEAIAVVVKDDILTYRLLNDRANRLAHWLKARGVGPEVRVAVVAGRSAEAIVGILGVLKAGGAYVPIDPDYPENRRAFVVADSRAAVVLDGSDVSVDHLTETYENPNRLLSSDQAAYLIYTSGSTGTPKGVIVTRGNLGRSTAARRAYYTEPIGAFLVVSSFAFDSSVAGLFGTLTRGGAVILPGPGEQADPAALARLIRERQVTHVLSVPSLYSLLLEIAPTADLKSLRAAIVAGEPCPRDLPERHWATLPNASLDNEYGPTEATVWASVHRFLSTPDAKTLVPIGRPIAGTDAYILDPRMHRVSTGVTGELYLGGESLARGYHGQAGLTAERFLPDPFSGNPGSRIYRTGDLARFRSDGAIECLGRVDGQVKIRGHRVELGELEACLVAHPKVREAVASARQELSGETKLVAYVVPVKGEVLTLADLRAWAASRLPDAFLPGVFAVLELLPVSPNGKVDRKALPDPMPLRLAASAGSEAPRNGIEDALAKLAAGLLGVETLGVFDNLFELGLDSIIAIQLVARARQAGWAFSPAEVFEHPTIAGLASVAQCATTKKTKITLTPINIDAETLARLQRPGLEIEDAYPLTPLQEGMLVNALFSPGRGEYVQQLVCRIRGPLDTSALEEAWRRLTERHEILRTGFDWLDRGRPTQAVYRGVQMPFTVQDWRHFSADRRESALEDALRVDRERGFDPATPPLSRLAVFRFGESEARLVWTYHHLLVDGWSLQSLLQELLAVYHGVVAGDPLDLPARTRFRDYVAWLSTQERGRSEPFWRSVLKGFKAATPLGIERIGTGPALDGEPYEEHEIALSPESTAALQAMIKQGGLTLATVVQGAWAFLLGRYSGRDDVVFGVTVSGRSAPVAGVEEIVGLLINTIPARALIETKSTVSDWLTRLQSRLVEARRFEDAPLALIQSWSELPRGKPLFESVVIFENYPVDDALQARAGGLGFGLVRVLERTHVPLTVMAFPGSRLRLRMVYDARRFDAAMVDRMAGHLACLLDAIASGPDREIGMLPMATTAELRQALDQWNDPRARPAGDGAGLLDDLDQLSDEDVEALIGKYLGRDEVSE